MIDYQLIIDYCYGAGKRLLQKQWMVDDIGLTKQWLTEEDIKIEQGLAKIIHAIRWDFVTDALFSEELHDKRKYMDNVWIADPISGTKTFLDGMSHYSIIVGHFVKGEMQFAVIYDPSVDECFTAYKGQWAFLNGTKIERLTKTGNDKVILSLTFEIKDNQKKKDIFAWLSEFELYRSRNSHGIDICNTAMWRYNAGVIFAKDIFPLYPGSLIIKELGLTFTNLDGESDFKHTDRIFVYGEEKIHGELLDKVREICKKW